MSILTILLSLNLFASAERQSRDFERPLTVEVEIERSGEVGARDLFENGTVAGSKLKNARFKIEMMTAKEVPLNPKPCVLQCWGEGNVTILTISGGLPKPYLDCMRENRKRYATKYGLAYCQADEAMEHAASYSFNKFIGVKTLFEKKGIEAVWWLDADAVIANDGIRITDIMETHADKDAIYTEDTQGPKTTNAGVFVMRNTDWSKQFMDIVWDVGEEFPSSQYWGDDRLSMQHWWHANEKEFEEHVAIVPLKVMSSFPGMYQEGDFIYHHAGTGNTYPGSESQTQMRKYEACLDVCSASAKA